MQADQHRFYRSLGHVLESRRHARGLSRRQLCEQLGDPRRSHSCYQYERAISRPSIWWLMDWCREMGLTVEEVIDEASEEREKEDPLSKGTPGEG